MKKLLFVALMGLCLCSCSQWPKIYLGQSDGWLTYDSGVRHLEVHWNRNTAIQGPTNDSIQVDTVTVREILY